MNYSSHQVYGSAINMHCSSAHSEGLHNSSINVHPSENVQSVPHCSIGTGERMSSMELNIHSQPSVHEGRDEFCIPPFGHQPVVTQNLSCDSINVAHKNVKFHSSQVVKNLDSGSLWCLICNKSFLSYDCHSLANVHKVHVTVTQRSLYTMLLRILNRSSLNVESEYLCQKCFLLVQAVDELEVELADTKLGIKKQFETTLAIHDSTAEKSVIITSLEDYDSVPVGAVIQNDLSHSSNETDKAKKSLGYKEDNTATGYKQSKKRKCKVNDDVHLIKKCKRPGGTLNKTKQKSKETLGDCAAVEGEISKVCLCCKKVVASSKYLRHLSYHRSFPCPFCEQIFKRKDIKMHLAENHQEEMQFPCIECNQVFDTFMHLRHHWLVSHIGMKYDRIQCGICKRTFSSVTGLRLHIATIHENKQPFECPECKEKFNQKGNMQNHMKRVHQGKEARKVLCDICSKGFICPSDLRKHVERVHLKVRKGEVFCDICGKPFSDARAVKIHVNAIHTKAVQYPCPDCKVMFHSLTNMVTHRRRMHIGPEGRKHVCDICGKGFCSPSDLRTHVKVVHESERRYACDVCGQSFKVGSHLKYHRRKHTGETPHECPHCGKCFHGPSHIADHIKKVHKTVYMGLNQRRRLNLPENAPPPPPGILPSQEARTKVGILNATLLTTRPVQGDDINQNQASSSTASLQQIHSMMPFSGAPNASEPINDHHTITHIPYQNINVDQSTESPVPMVVRLMHDVQY